MTDFKHIRVEEQNGVTIVHITEGELSDLMIQGDLRNDFDKLVEDQQPMKVLVYFGVVTFTTTGAIESLLRLRHQVQEYGGQVKLCGMTDLVRQAFRVLNLEDKVFEVWDTIEDGVASFTK